MSNIFNLTKHEAEALHIANINTSCPLQYATNSRKVWWILNNKLTYTICGDCYINNRFGEYNIDIKSKLYPAYLNNLPCFCDGKINNEIRTLTVDDFNIGIYSVNEDNVNCSVKLLNVDYTTESFSESESESEFGSESGSETLSESEILSSTNVYSIPICSKKQIVSIIFENNNLKIDDEYDIIITTRLFDTEYNPILNILHTIRHVVNKNNSLYICLKDTDNKPYMYVSRETAANVVSNLDITNNYCIFNTILIKIQKVNNIVLLDTDIDVLNLKVIFNNEDNELFSAKMKSFLKLNSMQIEI